MRTFEFTVQATKKWPAVLIASAYLSVLVTLIASNRDFFHTVALQGNRVVNAAGIVVMLLPAFMLIAFLDSQRTVQINQEDLVVRTPKEEVARIALADIGTVRVTALSRCLEICDRAGNVRIRLNCHGLTNPSDAVLDELLHALPGRETRKEGRVQELRWTDRSVEFLPV
ncbi:hypothetical protein [Arachnia propionica]|uniref:Uncharacterized protein n=1 Tax=Arachnia propionica TaxID=1750 RepID=A0A3P1WVY3_9ACTN|nr:hypothetical protein [Arachnia propionica]RRD50752.1 hypothetical protein EII35_03205 [Arachnia propionica]